MLSDEVGWNSVKRHTQQSIFTCICVGIRTVGLIFRLHGICEHVNTRRRIGGKFRYEEDLRIIDGIDSMPGGIHACRWGEYSESSGR